MLIFGHRGAAGQAPENTIKSFQKALEIGLDAIELDVNICKTGELVVIHDLEVNRTTNGKGYVSEMTLSELKKLDAGDGEKIPTLKEVLGLIDKKAKINIELKGIETAKASYEIIEEYVKNKGWEYKHFIVSSFNHQALKKFRTLNPQIEIGALIVGVPLSFEKIIEEINPISLNLSIEFIDEEIILEAKKHSLKIYAWTVNNLEELKKMQDLKVDGIFTDYPEKFINLS